MSTTSRAILLFAVVFVACAYLVSAAPIVNNESSQLELQAVEAPRINMFRKHHDHDDEEEEEYTTSTSSTYTSTRTRRARPTTTTTAEPTTTEYTTTTTTSAKPSPTPKKNASSSSSSDYSGDATFYGTGLGSCGIVSKDSDYIVALNHGQMKNGANPNNNALCGKKITAHGPDGSITVTIVDTCPGCAVGDLDLSPAAFSKIADMDRGRVPVSWSFN
ncbi:RlpA-like double-psi beta-barrel-protein domain-containing protein-containing protein [Helicostylum pulchrum]|nr:RlpA-like double-psi beta-barrel-protein domain-containing protein-containing protein [Helicostylum pulchrum]